jgi:fumarylacetoacetase
VIDRPRTDDTHDPALRSWVESANEAATDFPVQNLPFGTFRHEFEERPRVGVAIGDQVLDCLEAARAGCFDALNPAIRDALQSWSLNALMELDRHDMRAIRAHLSRMLASGGADAEPTRTLRDRVLVPMQRVSMIVPAAIGDYTDFYASIHHARRVGALFRPDNPLLPNYQWVPIGYHGRASSVVASGTSVRRPRGQVRPGSTGAPTFGPCANLDYEVELAIWIGGDNAIAEPVPIARADDRIFGIGIMNDWSARDIQSWEYQPLGPFLSKNFLTTVSPWIVTAEALEPFRAPLATRGDDEPKPLAYLDDARDRARGAFDVTLEVSILTAAMRVAGAKPHRLSRSEAKSLYWTPAQMIAHHTSSGCNLRAGDLLGSGTISGPDDDGRGCLLELTRRGAEPVAIPGGETRKFLEDGDEVIIRGRCERQGAVRIGFGECRGIVGAAK